MCEVTNIHRIFFISWEDEIFAALFSLCIFLCTAPSIWPLLNPQRADLTCNDHKRSEQQSQTESLLLLKPLLPEESSLTSPAISLPLWWCVGGYSALSLRKAPSSLRGRGTDRNSEGLAWEESCWVSFWFTALWCQSVFPKRKCSWVGKFQGGRPLYVVKIYYFQVQRDKAKICCGERNLLLISFPRSMNCPWNSLTSKKKKFCLISVLIMSSLAGRCHLISAALSSHSFQKFCSVWLGMKV